MARLKEWMDLSELGDYASLLAGGWTRINGGATAPTVTGVTHYADVLGNGGAYSMQLSSSDDDGVTRWVSPPLPSPLSEVYLRFHHYLAATDQNWRDDRWSNTGPFLFLQKFGTALIYFASDDDGRIVCWRGDAVELGRTTTPLVINQWSLLEFYVKIDDSAGEVEVRIDGVPRLTLSGIDTKPGSDTAIDTIVLGCSQKTVFTSGAVRYFDDLTADDTDWINESVITALHPDDIGNTTELTPSGAGDNWEMVDETPPSDSDYNSTLVANKKDTYLHTALPGAASTIKAVLTAARVARTGSDISTAYLITRSGGTDYEDAGQAIATVPSLITKLEEVDPDTGIAWVVGDVNTSEMGIRFDV